MLKRKKSPLKATRLHQRKRRLRIIKTVAVVLVVLALFGITVWVSHAQLFALTNVNVQGAVNIDPNQVQLLAQKDLAGAYAALYPKNNKILYSKKTIEQDIKNSFPGINTLTISTSGHTLDVSLNERKPTYIWCTGMPNDGGMHDCYFMDAMGYLFASAPQVSGNAYLVFYGIITDANPIGKTFLSPQEFDTINVLKKTFDTNDIAIDAIVAEDDVVRDIYLSHAGKIIFKADEDPATLASTIDLLNKNTELFNSKATSTLEYVDLRFGNKIYYKFVGDNAVQSQ